MKAVDMVNAVQVQIVDIASLVESSRLEEAAHSLKKLESVLDAYREMLQKERK